jgi:hypothetical protein
MAGSLRRRTTFSLAAGLLSVGLFVTACQPEQPPEPPRPSPDSSGPSPSTSGSPQPGPSQPLPSQPGPGGTVHFTAQGDIGVGSGAKKVLDAIAELKPQLNLALGDFSYKSGIEEQFCDMVTGKLGTDLPYQLVTGNHESDGHEGDIENFIRCLPNKLPGMQGEYGTQWYADVPEKDPVVRFVLVSPGIDFRNGPLDYSRGSERWRWTTDAIDSAKAQGIPWTVVGMHVPCFSVGEYDCQAGEEFTNMLIEKKVDLVLSGHDHVYQRTHQLGMGASCPGLKAAAFATGCLADSDSSMLQGQGTVFATVGTGGVGLYNINSKDPEMGYFAMTSGKNRNPTFGTLDVQATQGELAARFVPAKGYSLTDSFTIQRR